MILYLDTSAFVKLYVNEPGAKSVHDALDRADLVSSHWIAYPEMRATLGRLHRAGRQTRAELTRHEREFESDWRAVYAVLPEEHMLRHAGDLAVRFGLRGYDSVHLAAAVSLANGAHRHPMCFASFDDELNDAASALGLPLLDAARDRPQ